MARKERILIIDDRVDGEGVLNLPNGEAEAHTAMVEFLENGRFIVKTVTSEKARNELKFNGDEIRGVIAVVTPGHTEALDVTDRICETRPFMHLTLIGDAMDKAVADKAGCAKTVVDRYRVLKELMEATGSARAWNVVTREHGAGHLVRKYGDKVPSLQQH